MVNLGYEIALPVGVNLHPQGEHALIVAVAALSMAVATLRACSQCGSSCSPRGSSHALSSSHRGCENLKI